jgi:MerR family transcriptional regulator, light-induced transcriptional regulator
MAEYKIKDLETLTGIKAHTIRIWEKRYGLLSPVRTDTNLRTYSDSDLQTILTVSVLNNNGLKISRIAEMSANERATQVQQYQLEAKDENAIEQLILALLQLNEQLFCTTIADLIEKHGLEQAFSSYIIQFFDRIGVMWLVGTINPAQEHFVTYLFRQKIISAIDKLDANTDVSAKKVVLYLPEHEWHELGLLFYQYVLKKNGWKIFYLGQSVPSLALTSIIEYVKPDLVLSSWVVSVDEKLMLSHIQELQSFYSGKIALGGFQVKNKSIKNVVLIDEYEDLKLLIEKMKKK